MAIEEVIYVIPQEINTCKMSDSTAKVQTNLSLGNLHNIQVTNISE